MDPASIVFIILMIVVIIMTLQGTKKQQTAQADEETWRVSLHPGDEVATRSGLLARVVEVFPDNREVILDSEGTRTRWRLDALVQPPVKLVGSDEESTDTPDASDASDVAVGDNAGETPAADTDSDTSGTADTTLTAEDPSVDDKKADTTGDTADSTADATADATAGDTADATADATAGDTADATADATAGDADESANPAAVENTDTVTSTPLSPVPDSAGLRK